MRKILSFLMLVPLFAISQNQTVISAQRYFPKPDKVLEFEKALVSHIQKYHSGDWKWRVYEIQTGPDAGGYHIVEGPKTWDEFDKRGDLGAEHLNDWNKNVAPNLSDKYSSGYSDYREDLSTTQLLAFTNKITITHVFPKPGMGGKVEADIKKIKKGWEAGNQTVAVYQAVASGPTQYAIVSRLKDGLKELQSGYRKPIKERYDAANGEGTYEIFLDHINKTTENNWSEILSFRADLSSK
ncbi:MAG: hypothetical protein JST17_01195 [Bacteroidetes bacterium]|nr:hypothetical protein [Bacteroidota bacterium]MBS1931900.1 hypothetical protein [Bacteroidota bacterium]